MNAHAVSADAVVEALRGVADPEIPNVSVVDLGMVGAIDVGPDGVRVELLPTFVGCPALEVIRADVARAVQGLGMPVEVEVSFATPWSSDRITPLGRERLRSSGFAPPPPAVALDAAGTTAVAGDATGPNAASTAAQLLCPHCGSDRVAIDSLFGPTQCRSLYYCRACRQPFEAFKAV